jgi:hypothetical protein
VFTARGERVASAIAAQAAMAIEHELRHDPAAAPDWHAGGAGARPPAAPTPPPAG